MASQQHIDLLREFLAEYRKEHGKLPTSAEQFEAYIARKIAEQVEEIA